MIGWMDGYESTRHDMIYHARIRLLFSKQHNQIGERQMLIPKLTIEWVDSRTANKSASIHCQNARVIKKVNAYQPKILGWIAPRESDLNTAKWGFGEVAEHPRITLYSKTVKPNLQFQLDSGMVSQIKFDSFWKLIKSKKGSRFLALQRFEKYFVEQSGNIKVSAKVKKLLKG